MTIPENDRTTAGLGAVFVKQLTIAVGPGVVVIAMLLVFDLSSIHGIRRRRRWRGPSRTATCTAVSSSSTAWCACSAPAAGASVASALVAAGYAYGDATGTRVAVAPVVSFPARCDATSPPQTSGC